MEGRDGRDEGMMAGRRDEGWKAGLYITLT